jgi:phosphoglycolate phosphatase
MNSSKLPFPAAVIFDWDSTLVDNWRAIHLSLNATLIEMGHQTWTEEETRKRSKSSARDAFPNLFGEKSEQALKFFYEAFERFQLETLKVLNGAEELIKVLSENEIYLAIVSNKNGDHLRKEVIELGWSGYFQKVVGASDAIEDKPSIEPVKMALKNTGLGSNSIIWFVGDSGVDLQCATISGCVPILIEGSGIDGECFKDCPPHSVFSSCEKLKEAFLDI